MTLIITELSEFGIAMVADSAVTFKEQAASGLTITRVLNGAQKLQVIPYLGAGISMWGLAELPGAVKPIPTDVWLFDFIQRHTTIKSIDEFANELAHELQEAVGNIKIPMGFHLAGYVEQEGKRLPTLYHVRNVDGTYNDYQHREFIPGHDIPPRHVKKNEFPGLRNGDFGPYAALSEAVNRQLPTIKSMGLSVPYPSLQGRIDYLVAWVKFIADLYASSMTLPKIGGSIASLGITPEGQRFYHST